LGHEISNRLLRPAADLPGCYRWLSQCRWGLPQQTAFANVVNPQFVRTMIAGPSGVQMIAAQNRIQAINASDLWQLAVTADPNMTWAPIINTAPSDIFDNAHANSSMAIVASVEFPTVTPISYQWQATNTNGLQHQYTFVHAAEYCGHLELSLCGRFKFWVQ
jgi:hypothetical protein